MTRTAGEAMLTDFPFVDCNASVAEAEEFFERSDLAALPVLNPDRTVFGLLTPKHLAAFHRRPGANARAAHAWEICETRPLLGRTHDTLDELTAALLGSGRRHALIVNDAGELIGVLSTDMLLARELAAGRSEPAPGDAERGGQRLS